MAIICTNRPKFPTTHDKVWKLELVTEPAQNAEGVGGGGGLAKKTKLDLGVIKLKVLSEESPKINILQ